MTVAPPKKQVRMTDGSIITVPAFSIRAYSHAIAEISCKHKYAYSFLQARSIAREMAQENFIEKTVILSRTGKEWVTYWDRFMPDGSKYKTDSFTIAASAHRIGDHFVLEPEYA